MDEDITIVIMTRNRKDGLRSGLSRLVELPGAPPIIVVDNGSTDGTTAMVDAAFPQVEVVPLGRNAGVAARNVGVRRATTPYIAFADDDSWWAPGALPEAVRCFERHRTIGAITGHVIVEPGGIDDPINELMRESPAQGDPSLPGTPVLGFLACATVVRRQAFLEVGGFNERFHFGGEEQLLAADLASAGWEVRYLATVRVHHQPSARRRSAWRRRRDVRNTLWFLWLRRHPGAALRRSLRLLAEADRRAAIGGLGGALLGLPWVLRGRAPVPPDVERSLQRLDEGMRST